MKLFVLALFVAVAAGAPLDDSNGPVELIVNGAAEGEPLELGDILEIKLKEHSDGEVVATDLLHPLTAVGIAEAAVAAAAEGSETDVILPEAVITPEVVIPEAVVLPAPAQPDVVLPEAVVMPAPVQPEVLPVLPVAVVMPPPTRPEVVLPDAVFSPSPVQPEIVIPEAVVLPAPVLPEVVIPEAVVLPAPAQPEVVFPESVVHPSPIQPEVVIPGPAIEEESAVMPSPAAQLPIGEVFNDGIVQVSVNAPHESGVISTLQGWFNMVLNYISDGTIQETQQIV